MPTIFISFKFVQIYLNLVLSCSASNRKYSINIALLLDFSLALDFYVSPEIIIFSWYGSCDFCDQVLNSSPKISFFKNWIHPSINDAISSIELSCMMSVVFLMAQNQSGGLEESDDWMGFLMDHMSPLMNLVCENS